MNLSNKFKVEVRNLESLDSGEWAKAPEKSGVSIKKTNTQKDTLRISGA